jgi:hypothetical protein
MRSFSFLFILAFAASAFAAAPSEFTVGAFTFERPAGWDWVVPSSTFRKAQMAVKGPNGEIAEVNFFHFGPGQGGGIEANIERWFGQFQNAQTSRSETSSGRTRIFYVQASGTFFSGMPGGPTTPMANYGLRGAILEDQENGDVFIKMTGPIPLVEAAWPAFDVMVRTAAGARH